MYVAGLNHADSFDEVRVLGGLLLRLTVEGRGVMIDLDVLLQVSQKLFAEEVLRKVKLELLNILILPLAASTNKELFVVLDELAMREQVGAHFVE